MSTLAQQQAAYLDEYSRLQGGGQSEFKSQFESLLLKDKITVGYFYKQDFIQPTITGGEYVSA